MFHFQSVGPFHARLGECDVDVLVADILLLGLGSAVPDVNVINFRVDVNPYQSYQVCVFSFSTGYPGDRQETVLSGRGQI